jgi:hypothetical protein
VHGTGGVDLVQATRSDLREAALNVVVCRAVGGEMQAEVLRVSIVKGFWVDYI